MPKSENERSADDEIQYWRNLNNIGCLNPEACDRFEENGVVFKNYFCPKAFSSLLILPLEKILASQNYRATYI